MRTLHMRAAVITAIVLGLAAPAAVAANASEPTKGATKAAEAKAAHKPEHPAKPAKAKAKAKAKHEHNLFVNAGTVTAVDATAGTLTFTVRGGRDKALRGKPLTVTVTATTKIRRNDADAKLAAVVVGDHVNVKGTKKAGVYTATRIAASKAGTEHETELKKD